MNITLMWNQVTGNHTIVILQNGHHATVSTLYMVQVVNLINILKPVDKISIVFHTSFTIEKKEEFRKLMNQLAV